MTEIEVAFLRAIHERPHNEADRLVYADWLEDHDDSLRAALIRTLDERDLRLAYAKRLDGSRECVGLYPFAEVQTWLAEYVGPRTAAVQEKYDWEYAELLRQWRLWLPRSVSTLTRKAERQAYNRDYFFPAITFPSRRRNPHRIEVTPMMSVAFWGGLPLWVECDEEDWNRAGLDLLARFPWLKPK